MNGSDIVVRFGFTKGDGEYPSRSSFSAVEMSDIRPCLNLGLYWDPGRAGLSTRILRLEIIYDGISPVEGQDFGYRLNGDTVEGYPAPIIRFHLSDAVDHADFQRCVSESWLSLKTAGMGDFWYAEDHSGYTEAMTSEGGDEWIEWAQTHGVHSGVVLEFPDGMPEEGHSIPGTVFGLRGDMFSPAA